MKGLRLLLLKMVREHEKLMVDALAISRVMRIYGGSFVRCLGDALAHADMNNKRKIKEAFSDYWNAYEKIARTEGYFEDE